MTRLMFDSFLAHHPNANDVRHLRYRRNCRRKIRSESISPRSTRRAPEQPRFAQSSGLLSSGADFPYDVVFSFLQEDEQLARELAALLTPLKPPAYIHLTSKFNGRSRTRTAVHMQPMLRGNGTAQDLEERHI